MTGVCLSCDGQEEAVLLIYLLKWTNVLQILPLVCPTVGGCIDLYVRMSMHPFKRGGKKRKRHNISKSSTMTLHHTISIVQPYINTATKDMSSMFNSHPQSFTIQYAEVLNDWTPHSHVSAALTQALYAQYAPIKLHSTLAFRNVEREFQTSDCNI